MILADTSVWIDHFRRHDEGLEALLEQGQILSHPFVTGEIALGSLRQRTSVLFSLNRLPQSVVARDEEVLRWIEDHRLFAIGLGYVDAHLLAAVMLTPETRLWTRDRSLREAATRMGIDSGLN